MLPLTDFKSFSLNIADYQMKEKNRKTDTIKLRCTQTEKKLISKLAQRCGLTLSEYCRQQIRQGQVVAIPQLAEPEIEYFQILKTYCTNFNRISNLIKDRDPDLVSEVRNFVRELASLQDRII